MDRLKELDFVIYRLTLKMEETPDSHYMTWQSLARRRYAALLEQNQILTQQLENLKRNGHK